MYVFKIITTCRAKYKRRCGGRGRDGDGLVDCKVRPIVRGKKHAGSVWSSGRSEYNRFVKCRSGRRKIIIIIIFRYTFAVFVRVMSSTNNDSEDDDPRVHSSGMMSSSSQPGRRYELSKSELRKVGVRPTVVSLRFGLTGGSKRFTA